MVFRTVGFQNRFTSLLQGGFREVHTVRTHVGNVTCFVEGLRNAHCFLDPKAELAGGFLLQGRGGEWCGGAFGQGFLFDGVDRPSQGHGLVQPKGDFLFFFESLVQFGLEGAGFGPKPSVHAECRMGNKGVDFAFPLNQQTNGDRLDPTGR